MFVLKNVRYQGILHVEELEIPEGKVTALVGESGSGKSTLLKLLNHLISPDEGEIWFHEKSLSEYDPVELRRQVVMLPQTPALFGKTIQENLQVGLTFSGQSTATDKQLKEALEMVNLDKGLDQESSQLSGGEQQRLALARVLLIDPPVFLLDEPTSALDEDMEHLVMDNVIQKAKSAQKTVVMVTHSKAMADRFSDREIDVETFSGKKVSDQ